jgi:hypothetical protein
LAEAAQNRLVSRATAITICIIWAVVERTLMAQAAVRYALWMGRTVPAAFGRGQYSGRGRCDPPLFGWATLVQRWQSERYLAETAAAFERQRNHLANNECVFPVELTPKIGHAIGV